MTDSGEGVLPYLPVGYRPALVLRGEWMSPACPRGELGSRGLGKIARQGGMAVGGGQVELVTRVTALARIPPGISAPLPWSCARRWP